ncbi:MAG: hypothetical protein WCK77_24215 [Verrucomicrobiota bacterium]
MKPFHAIITKCKITIAIAALIFPSLQAADQPTETPEQIVQRIAELGPGVHEVKTENGHLKSVKVVGQAVISTVLGKAKGLEIAQKRAKASAQQAYIEWFKANATSNSNDANEDITVLEGDGKGLKEQRKSSETHTDSLTVNTAAIIRGLALIGKHVDADGTLTLVYAWSSARAAEAKEAAAANSDDHAAAPAEAQPSPKPSESPLKTKTTASPDFDR